MRENPHAMDQLRAIHASREPLYMLAEHVVDTAGRDVADVVKAVVLLAA